jgi:hypothetical protein
VRREARSRPGSPGWLAATAGVLALLAPGPAAPGWAARLPAAQLAPPGCPDAGRSGQVRALLVGVDDYREVDAAGRPYFAPLAGSANDAHLLAELLRRRGGAAQDVRLLVGRDATTDAFYAALNDLVAASRCGDFVVLHFSGHTWRGALALADASVRNGSGLLFEGELRRAVTALRNRGAFVLVHVDANLPEPLELDMGRGGRWRAAGGEGALDLAVDAGGFAGLYAGPFAFEQPVRLPRAGGGEEARVYGLFSFVTAAALGEDPAPTIRDLAHRIRARLVPRGRGSFQPAPVFESSEPDRVVLATGVAAPSAAAVPARLAPTKAPDARVEILAPRRTRGVTLVTPGALRVEGRVVPPDALAAVVVSGTQARLTGGGRFQADVQLRAGPQTVYAVAIFSDHSTATDSVEVQGGADEGGPEVAAGRSYVLAIGNSDYRHMARLRTPVADAGAVAELLRDRFGFETSLDLGEGRALPLILTDVGRREVFQALAQLRRRLGENDSLLVFYAGHGDRPRGASQAYWLPVDAEPDDHGNWISADDISSEVSLMNAGHVMIVADSCFSGGLLRGTAAPPPAARGERARWLAEVVRRRSRHLMSSGANEPVLDEGGRGHSVFARAFLEGLTAMPDDVFTGQQLFAARVQEPVAGRAGQTPQYGPILRSGHDGGDFVFRRVRGSR